MFGASTNSISYSDAYVVLYIEFWPHLIDEYLLFKLLLDALGGFIEGFYTRILTTARVSVSKYKLFAIYSSG